MMRVVTYYRLSCRDLGIDDDFVASGKSKSDVIAKMVKYVFKVHGIDPRELKAYVVRTMRNY
jgi:predicted small metal-binding protein